MSDTKIRRLKNRKTGKSASRSDAKNIANAMHDNDLRRTGRATGITTLRLPITPRLQNAIKKTANIYQLDWVIPRKSRLADGARNSLSEVSIRAGILYHYFEYERNLASRSKHYRAHKTLKRLLDWIVDSQRDPKSPLSEYLRLYAPKIYYDHRGRPRTRGRRWWADQLSKHRL